jgi:hypothetical protein
MLVGWGTGLSLDGFGVSCKVHPKLQTCRISATVLLLVDEVPTPSAEQDGGNRRQLLMKVARCRPIWTSADSPDLHVTFKRGALSYGKAN